jgi:hypothetical protein
VLQELISEILLPAWNVSLILGPSTVPACAPSLHNTEEQAAKVSKLITSKRQQNKQTIWGLITSSGEIVSGYKTLSYPP